MCLYPSFWEVSERVHLRHCTQAILLVRVLLSSLQIMLKTKWGSCNYLFWSPRCYLACIDPWFIAAWNRVLFFLTLLPSVIAHHFCAKFVSTGSDNAYITLLLWNGYQFRWHAPTSNDWNEIHCALRIVTVQTSLEQEESFTTV